MLMINTDKSQNLLDRFKAVFSYNSHDCELLKKGLSVELVYFR